MQRLIGWSTAAVSVVLGICACTPGNPRSAKAHERDPGTIIIGRAADAISLDPGRISDNESVEIVNQIYDTLIDADPEAKTLRPGLAKSWTVSTDGTVWQFELRDGVSFHDGTPLTAEAVVFSFERQRDPQHRFHRPDATQRIFSYWAAYYRNIKSVTATGPLSVTITIERPYAPFGANLTMFPVAIVSPTAVAQAGPDYYKWPVGTGPYRFVEWVDGRIVLERNDDYWGTKPKARRLVFRTIPDGRQRVVALESSAIDISYAIPPNQLTFVELHPELSLYKVPANNVVYLAMNCERPPFDDLRLRQAVNHAVDKTPVVKLAYQGLADPARTPLPPAQWGHHDPGERYPHDPKRARALIAEVVAEGKFDPEVPVRLYYSETPRPYLPTPATVARIIEAHLSDVGFKVEVVRQGFRSHITSTQSGEADLALSGWVGDNGDPDNFLYVLLDSDNAVAPFARNIAFFRDEALHSLLSKAQVATDRSEREQYYREAQELVADKVPWLPLVHSRIAVAARRDITGIRIRSNSHIIFDGVTRQARR